MKRMVAVALAMLLAVMPVAVYGEEAEETKGVALDAMTLRELVTLQGQVEQEIYKRTGLGFEDDAIGTGKYVVGVDIKTGKYDLLCVQVSVSPNSWDNVSGLIVYETNDINGNIKFRYENINIGDRITINLEEGNILGVLKCNLRIKPFEHSWMP